MEYSPKTSFSQGSRPHIAKVASNIVHCFHAYALSELHRKPVVSLASGGGLKGRVILCKKEYEKERKYDNINDMVRYTPMSSNYIYVNC